MGKKRGNGEGSIYYSASRKTYVGQIILCGKRRSVYGKTKKEVASKLKELETEAQGGYIAEKTDYTVAELIRELIEDDYAMGITGNNSYLRKLETLKRIETKSIGKTKIEKATEKGIKDFLIAESRICSTSTLSKTYALLKRCFKEAEKRKYIANSPLTMNCPKSRLPTVKVRALTLQEQKRLLNYLHSNKTKYGAQMEIMMLTGMRMGEINALKLSDIDLNGKRLFVNRTVTVDENNRPVLGETTKTYAGIREVCLTPAVLTIVKKSILEQAPNPQNLLFCDKEQRPFSTSQVNSAFMRIIQTRTIIDANVPGKVSLHSLRHTYATRCIESGMPPEVLQKILGHTDVSITINTYCDVFDDFKQQHIDTATAYFERVGIM